MIVTRDIIKSLCEQRGITQKELARQADMNYNGLINKLHRNTLTLSDTEKLLKVLGYTLDLKKIR